MYHMIVDGPIAAHGWESEEDTKLGLSSEIVSALTQLHLLQDGLLVRHPIRRDHLVQGRTVQHTPSFSQRNGRLYVMEHIDLSSPKTTKIRERAGYIGYMFEDIKDQEKDARAYSIIRPSGGDQAEAVNYTKTVLRNVSEIVNWSDVQERESFLKEREQVADSI